VTSDLLIIAIR